MKWPTYDQLKALAKKASKDGFKLRMERIGEFWTWVWLHDATGMTFQGACDTDCKPVALSCALQSVPVFISKA